MRTVLMGLAVVVAAVVGNGWAQAGDGGEPTLQVGTSGGYAAYLTDGAGMSLYMFLNDRDGQSFCSTRCLEKWTPYTVTAEPALGDGIDPALVGTIQREDGATQVTYNGKPLYHSVLDAQPADTKGQGSGGLWFLITPTGERAVEAAPEDAAAGAEAGAEAGAATAAAGFFTVEQTQRGQRAYEANCAVCHHASLLGEQYAPALRGASFFRKWQGKTIGDLYAFMHANMPQGAPGSLTDQQYTDILAYILQANDYPVGATELPVDAIATDDRPVAPVRP